MKPPKAVSAYLAAIGRRGGAAGRGPAKARTTWQARKAAKVRWDQRRLLPIPDGKKKPA